MLMKSKLHKLVIVLSALLLLPIMVQAQRDRDLTYRYYSLAENRSFAHWSYALEIGGNIFDGDIREDYPQLIPSAKLHPTVGGKLERSFNPVFGLGLQYMYIPYKAEPKDIPYKLTGTAHEANIFLSVSMLNLFYQTRKQRWNIYGTIGWGFSFYSAQTINTITGEYRPALDNSGNPTGHVMKLDDGQGYVIPVGLHVEYNINRTFALGLNGEYRMHNKDNYEGSPLNIRKGNSNDAFSVVTLSFRHKLFFGKDREMHTRTATYAELIPMKDNRKDIEDLEDEIDELRDMIEGIKAAESCCKEAMNKITDLEDAMKKIADLEDQLAQRPETIIIREERVPQELKPDPKPVIEVDAQERIQKAFDLALRGIQFETDKAVIKTVSYPILDNVVSIMREHPDFELDIIGHTDNVGSAPYNLNLSNRRANSVRQYLIDRGINASRLTADGKGLTKPIATNTTAEGRQQNRRVEFVVRIGDEIIYSTDKDLYSEDGYEDEDEYESQSQTSRSTVEISDFNPDDYEMTYVVVAKGTRLALFSTQNYGSYMFWPYIYLANQDVLSPDPNALVIGTKLRIPKLPAEMIDVNNPDAVERVNEIRDQLLGE